LIKFERNGTTVEIIKKGKYYSIAVNDTVVNSSLTAEMLIEELISELGVITDAYKTRKAADHDAIQTLSVALKKSNENTSYYKDMYERRSDFFIDNKYFVSWVGASSQRARIGLSFEDVDTGEHIIRDYADIDMIPKNETKFWRSLTWAVGAALIIQQVAFFYAR